MKNHFEDDLQIACMSWLSLAYPDIVAFFIPNGGKRNAREAARFKKMGVKKGIPDIHIAEPSGEYHGLYIELKSGKNRLTDNQKQVISKLMKNKYRCEVCYSLEDFMNSINNYLKQ